MASIWGILCTCFLILAAVNIPSAAAKELKVGDAKGWREPSLNETSMYSQWATSKRFHVGDFLSFDCQQNDSALLVEKWSYFDCNTSNPIASFNGRKSLVRLDRPGFFYFISGAPHHCQNGQRVVVDVMSQHRPPLHSPPSIAVPPESYSRVSPAPSPVSSSGVAVSVTVLCSVFRVLVVATFVAL